MIKFEFGQDTQKKGFSEQVTVNMYEPVENWLRRAELSVESIHIDTTSRLAFKKTILWNSSLRVDFGWSFDSNRSIHYMMEDVINSVQASSMYIRCNIVTDTQLNWIGFLPYNIFETVDFDSLSNYGLIVFNNNLIKIQTDIISKVISHKRFLEHAILRDSSYRYNFFRSIRHDENILSDAFHSYMDAFAAAGIVSHIPIEMIEQDIGSHFLRHPDLFFELMNFYTLKGMIT
jgi:hypothetical protein